MRNDPVQPQMSKRKQLFELFIANEQAERRRSAFEAASLMPLEVL